MEGTLRIYGDIGYDWYDNVENTANAIVSKIEELKEKCSKIVVHINSVGGFLYDGLPIFNSLKHCGIPVHTVIDGCAMSMAGVIFQAGTRRSMCRSSLLHIHAPEGFVYGNSVALRQGADDLEAWSTPLIAAIAAKCGKKADEVRAMWFDGKDHFFNPDEALAAGLIDDIYDADAEFPEDIAPENITNMAARDVRDIYARAYNKQEKSSRLFGLFPAKNSKTKTPRNDMDIKKLCARLGLKPNASEKEILDAIDRRKTPKNEAGSDEQTKPEEEKEVEQQVEEAQQTAEEAQTTAEEAQQTAEETQEELEELKEKVETLEQEKEALTEELAAYKNKSNRGGGAPARSDFKNTARNVKDEWGYIKGNIFD